MANLPRTIQEQLEQAQALHEQHRSPEHEVSAPLALLEPAAPPESPATEQSAAAGEPPAQGAQPPAQPAEAKPEESPWEAKYRTLQGLFNKEVPALQRRARELETQLTQAQHALQQFQSRESVEVKPPAASTTDVDEFDPAVESPAQRVAAQAAAFMQKVSSVVSALEQRLTQVERTQAGQSSTIAATAEEVFESRLTASVPTWREVNVQQAFLDWLAEVDPIAGTQRQAALNAAHQSLDAGRVSAIFGEFLKTQVRPAAAQVPTAVAKQVAPSTAAPAAPQAAPAQKPVVTQAQVAQFYQDLASGRYRGNEVQARALEAAIDQAMAEGRVR